MTTEQESGAKQKAASSRDAGLREMSLPDLAALVALVDFSDSRVRYARRLKLHVERRLAKELGDPHDRSIPEA